MRRQWAAILVLCAGAMVGMAAPAAVADDRYPTEYVVVQYDRGVAGQALRDGPATLDELGFEKVAVPPGQTAEETLAELRSDPRVISAERDVPVYAAETPADPLYEGNQASYLETIEAPQAWDLSLGSEEIVVAVLDTGVDLNHEDLRAQLWENSGETPGNGVDDDGNGCIDDRYGCRFVDVTSSNASGCGYTSSTPTGNVMDDNGNPGTSNHSHGTMVAGIVGAAASNGHGIAGVGWNVRIMPVKVLDCGGPNGSQPRGNMSNVAEGIEYARRMGADIINLSLASNSGVSGQRDDIPALRAAIQAAQDAGIIIVAAAGNFGSSSEPGPGYPAAYTQYENVIAVGASNPASGNTWASFSSYGPALDFAAPGVGIASTVRSDISPSSPYRVATDGGTSFATPMVSGTFALMKARNSRLAASDYIAMARETASPAPPAPHGGNWAGSGIINAGEAVAHVPMLITGAALHNWKDVGPGIDMRARVDGSQCATTTTEAFGPATRFELRIPTEAEQSGCGAPGKTVQLYIDGTPAQPTFTWGLQGEDLALISKDVTTVSPPPGPVVVQHVSNSWSNIAHLDAAGDLPEALSYLPSTWVAAQFWDPLAKGVFGTQGGYRRVVRGAPDYVNTWSRVRRYDTYWVDSASAASVAMVNPDAPAGRVRTFQPGWNNFVYTGTSKPVAEALKEIEGRYTQVLQYDNQAQLWRSYLPGQPRYLNDFGGMMELRVYWIYMERAGGITMD